MRRTAACGSLEVEAVTLSCGSWPAWDKIAGLPIPIIQQPPSVTCSHGIRGTVEWIDAPTWSSPAASTYSNIKARATCGSITKTANCSELEVRPCTANDNGETDDNGKSYYCLKGCNDKGTMEKYGYLPDSRDGKTYKTVVIGTQTWMAENLNYNAIGSVCFNRDDANCTKYGRLYDWVTAMNIDDDKYYSEGWNEDDDNNHNDVEHQGICPDGWHLPNMSERNALINFVESKKECSNDVGTNLKSIKWDILGMDEYGFSALPGGNYRSNDGDDYTGSFEKIDEEGIWWSATDLSKSACFLSIYGNKDYTNYTDSDYADCGDKAKFWRLSVRCVENDNTP